MMSAPSGRKEPLGAMGGGGADIPVQGAAVGQLLGTVHKDLRDVTPLWQTCTDLPLPVSPSHILHKLSAFYNTNLLWEEICPETAASLLTTVRRILLE